LALLDFSSITDSIVGRTGELAKLYGAKCWLMHIARPDPDFVGYDVGPKYIRDSRAEVLRKEHQQLQEYKQKLVKEGVVCEALLVQGQINCTIMAQIKKLNIDLVILGSHGHTRIHDLFVGSVCEHMLRHSKVPLLVIPWNKKKRAGW
jgi:nucleotide-binding universal stress UspA family protein